MHPLTPSSSSLGIDIGGTSVKVAVVREGRTVWTGRSGMYARPDRGRLVAALCETASECRGAFGAAGICVPGLVDPGRKVVTASVNVPGLVGQPLDELAREAFGEGLPGVKVATDAGAAGYDLYTGRGLAGRLLVLVLGTGVGAAVVDEGGLLRVDGDSPGHLGQMDVSIEGCPVIGPDGGAGSLEGYVGTAALRERYGEGFVDRLATLPVSEPAFRALARAIRIGHALYRPHHVCLAGGVGNALRPMLAGLRELVENDLTSIARAGWTLGCGDDDYHAARGAAKLAMIS